MKDRAPTYPGRVKLEPVVGQTNIYDMTRADVPTVTGTPFNTRTMLQDSTALFLNLPYANPLVDDAFRHLPDRIEPVGTVKTSPALSLGDAWLPCDGSQVTFAEYPLLYQILRNLSSATTWSGTAYTTDATKFNKMTDPIYFKGKWYIFGSLVEYSGSSTWQSHATLTLASASSLSGAWSIEKTWSNYNTDYSWTSGSAPHVVAAATEDKIVCVWAYYYNSNGNGEFRTFSSTDGSTWTQSENVNTHYAGEIYSVSSLVTNKSVWAFLANDATQYSSSPDVASSWVNVDSAFASGTTLSLCGDTWFAVSGGNIKTATTPSDTWATILNASSLPESSYAAYYSNVAQFAGAYYMVYASRYGGSSNKYVSLWLIKFSLNGEFTSKKIKTTAWTGGEYQARIVTGNRIMAILYGLGGTDGAQRAILTSSSPDVGFDDVALPSGVNPKGIAVHGDVVVCNNDSSVAYHDYTSDVRTLPSISLSDDTTTFIKAKNELDVFEAQQSGGD